MKRKTKFNLGMPIPGKLQRTGEVITAMTGNVNFTAPNPDLATVDAAIIALAATYQAANDGGKTPKAEQRTKNQELNDLLRPLRDYLN
jgi:hypothetical protein